MSRVLGTGSGESTTYEAHLQGTFIITNESDHELGDQTHEETKHRDVVSRFSSLSELPLPSCHNWTFFSASRASGNIVVTKTADVLAVNRGQSSHFLGL